jgi:hypothetical protein
MERKSGIKSEERVRRVHESFLFVRLNREDTKPHIERRDKSDGAHESLNRGALRAEDGLHKEERSRQYCENKPNVKVQQKISNVESPRFGTKDLGASSLTTENVVCDNVPRYQGNLVEESVVDRYLKGLDFEVCLSKYKAIECFMSDLP